jgi:hypothetical protein
MTGVLVVTQDPDDAVALGGRMHHRSEKRLGRILSKHQLSCMWHRVCGFDVNGVAIKPDHLLYELEMRFCIRCNTQHYFLGEKIEFEQTEFDPSAHFTLALEKMGYFAQFSDADGGNH